MNKDSLSTTYVVAVSGGVDSMVLLDMLVKQSSARLVVAHYDHGIRADSGLDRQLVQNVAGKYGLEFVYDEGVMGPNTSEDAARRARYTFLQKVRHDCGAQIIITAHHADDVIETVILQLRRGTYRRGLTSLHPLSNNIERPLLNMTKADLLTYAQQHGLLWREDSTNKDTRYARNYVRHHVVPRFAPHQQQRLHQIIKRSRRVGQQIDDILLNMLQTQPAKNLLDRRWFLQLPHSVAKEVLIFWLRQHDIHSYDKPLIEKTVILLKTAVNQRRIDINKEYIILVTTENLALMPRDR